MYQHCQFFYWLVCWYAVHCNFRVLCTMGWDLDPKHIPECSQPSVVCFLIEYLIYHLEYLWIMNNSLHFLYKGWSSCLLRNICISMFFLSDAPVDIRTLDFSPFCHPCFLVRYSTLVCWSVLQCTFSCQKWIYKNYRGANISMFF